LDGVWRFRVDWDNKGFSEGWHLSKFPRGSFIDMPVPASYNDITQDPLIKDFVGWTWYQTDVVLPVYLLSSDYELYIRFESVHYWSKVYWNDQLIAEHEGGHLPFEASISQLLLIIHLLQILFLQDQ
jgi:beta-glucuronidase